MNERTYLIFAIIIVTIFTFFTRAIPYILFRNKEIPKIITYLSIVLPMSIMIILVIFSIRNIDISNYPFGAPELIAVALVALLQYLRRNLLLSILAGTIGYMVLLRLF